MPPTSRALLLTDVVDSTKLSEALGDARMAQVWAAHDRVARDLLVPHPGREIDKTDGFLLLFETASDAATYAFAYSRQSFEQASMQEGYWTACATASAISHFSRAVSAPSANTAPC